jgi:hypothetical protein
LADNWKELIQNIKSHGMKPGVAIKPGTSVEEVYPLVCVFTNPLFSSGHFCIAAYFFFLKRQNNLFININQSQDVEGMTTSLEGLL